MVAELLKLANPWDIIKADRHDGCFDFSQLLVIRNMAVEAAVEQVPSCSELCGLLLLPSATLATIATQIMSLLGNKSIFPY